MHRFAILPGILLGFFISSAKAQEAAQKVQFSTIDGVELNGTFYPSGGKSPPVVILLHALGSENSSQKAWTGLAETLQKEKFSVLTFDFRGHGKSTSFEPARFYKFARNKLAGVSSGKTHLDFKSFDKSYYPVLVNDIAAARAFLDRTKNDLGDVNSSNIAIIGAETGATLGAIWLSSEWHRYKFAQNMFGRLDLGDKPEGKDITAAIWLSIQPKLGNYNVRVSSLLDPIGRTGQVPMVFMYAEGDAAGKKLAKDITGPWKKTKDKELEKQLRFTDAFGIKDGSKLTGSALLLKSLDTNKMIAAYLKETSADRGGEWYIRDFRKSQFVWRHNNRLLPAKITTTNLFPLPFVVSQFPDDSLLFYDTYDLYVR